MNRKEVQAWLENYVAAWGQRDPELIRALFSDDAIYRYRPYPGGKTLAGQTAIVAAWLEHKESPDEWEASYEVFAVDEERAVATGVTRYLGSDGEADEVFYNCFLMRFAGDGRCADFTEYWMIEPQPG